MSSSTYFKDRGNLEKRNEFSIVLVVGVDVAAYEQHITGRARLLQKNSELE